MQEQSSHLRTINNSHHPIVPLGLTSGPPYGFSRKIVLSENTSMVLIKRGGIGDFIIMTPALKALRNRYPKARIDIIVSSEKIKRFLTHYQLLDEIVVMPPVLFQPTPTLEHNLDLSAILKLRHQVRRNEYEVAICCNHFIPQDASFFSALMIASGAKYRVGLDCGSTDGFLDVKIPDLGFGAWHEAEYQIALVEALDAPVLERQLFVPINASLRERAHQRLAATFGDQMTRPLVAIHPGCFHAFPARRWGAEKFAAVADKIYLEFGGQVLLLGGPEEASLRTQVQSSLRSELLCHTLSGDDDLLITAALLEQCDLFIGNDSGLMHLATAVGTPTLGIFGLTNPRAWGPYMPQTPNMARSVYRELPCRPCNYVGLHSGDQLGCATRDCLVGLRVEDVMAVTRDLLSHRYGKHSPPYDEN